MSIGYKKQSAASVPTPPVGEVNFFVDSADDKFKKKLSDNTIVVLETTGGALTSADIANVAAGNISSTNVQDALNELDAEKAPITHVGSKGVAQHAVADGTDAGFMSPSDFTKLSGVANGATANDTDANLKNRANHTGTQTASTISDFNTAADARVTSGIASHTGATDPHPQYATDADLSAHIAASDPHAQYAMDSDVTAAQAYSIQRANHTGTQTASTISDFNTASDSRIALQKGQPFGLASLDSGGLVPAGLLPSFVDDVLEYANLAAFPVTGESGKIYIALDTNKTYRWSGSVYVEISSTPGTTDGLVEGSLNLYFTNARAKSAVVDDAIVNGVIDKAPSQNAVFDALAVKSEMTSLIGEVTASGTGAVPATVSNAAVVAKVLTGFSVDWNIITSADSILSAIQKLAGRAAMSLNDISGNVTIPTGYTWLRQNKTRLLGTSKITIQPGGKFTVLP